MNGELVMHIANVQSNYTYQSSAKYTNPLFRAYYDSFSASAVKDKIMNAKNTHQAADIFDSFIKEQTNHKKFWKFARLSNALLTSTAIASITTIGASLLTGNPLFALLGGGFGMGLCVINKKLVIPEMTENYGFPQDKELVKREKIKHFSEKIARGDLTIEELKNSHFWNEYYQLHKQDTQENLIWQLNNHYDKTSKEDKEKLIDFIMNNYDKYCWNELIPYCLAFSTENGNYGYHNGERSCKFENFMKLKEMSESVYYMYHNTIGILQPELNTNNDELYKMFKSEYPNKSFYEFIYNYWRRDENGIILDSEVENYRKVFGKQGPHYALWVLSLCNNKDGYIAWNCAEPFQDIAHYIDSVLYDNYKDFDEITRDMHLRNMLVDITEKSYNTSGKLDKDKFTNLIEQIKTEIDTVGIKNSRTIKQITDSYTRTELGIFDDDIESTEDAITKPNRLYDEIQRKDSISGYLKDTDCTPSEVFGLLYKLTTTEDGKSRIIEEFSSNPRMGQDIKDLLIEKLGGDKKAENYFNTWYYDEKYGYRSVYTEHYINLWNNAKNLLELIKQSPNIAPWAYIEKAEKLGISKNIGQIPQDFSDENNFKSILKQLRHIDKKYEKLIKQKTENIDFKNKITINNVEYIVEKINSGHSIKSKYEIRQNKEGANTYILKFIPHNITANSDKNYLLKESMMLKSDSPYLNALVDFYLKENGCKNSADIEYFDFDEQAVLYKKTEGILPEMNSIKGYDNVYDFNKNGNLKDIKDLGITFNDISYKNLIKQTDGTLVLIDSGHVKFTNPFRPEVIYKNISLSNLCGREIS